jgi:tRNA(Ile)-lysidine synthase
VLGAADVKAIASRLKIGIEEAARSARYSFLFQAATITRSDRIITGHTMNDQVETFLMRAARGSGTAGLTGMAPVRRAHQFEAIEATLRFLGPHASSVLQGSEVQGTWAGAGPPDSKHSDVMPLLIRPALCVTREEIEQYCLGRQLEFRVDASNLNVEFTRNQIRERVVPSLQCIEPQAVRSIARAMEILAIDNEALEQLGALALERARTREKGKTWGCPAGMTLKAGLLASQPRAISRRAILRALREVSNPGDEITSTHIGAVEALVRGGRSGKRVELAGGVRVWRERDWIVIDNQTTVGRTGEIDLTGGIELTEANRAVRAGGFLISLDRKVSLRMLEEVIDRAKSEKARGGRDWGMAVLDDYLIPDILVIRPRRPGERTRAVGQTDSNKLKKLMISHKIPVSRRASWPLAFTRDSRYVWSPGMPPSVEFAVNRETRSLAILSATEE